MEVLAPAGSMEMAKAAVHAGCDAIYCGGDFFGARAYAENFSLEAFKELIHYCHERKVKVYITLNTLIKNKEMAFAFQYAQKLYTLGVDAIIVQDIGLVSILTKVYPEMILPFLWEDILILENQYCNRALGDETKACIRLQKAGRRKAPLTLLREKPKCFSIRIA